MARETAPPTWIAAGQTIAVSNLTSAPGGPVYVQLPVFSSTGVNAVSGGSYNSATHTVTGTSAQIVITLAS